MQRKQTAIRGGVLGVAVITAAAAVCAVLLGGGAKNTPPTAHTESSAASAPFSGYIVGQWEGLLAVFAAPDTPPVTVYDVYIASLPPEEQVRLTAGIPAPDDLTLARLIEDYTG